MSDVFVTVSTGDISSAASVNVGPQGPPGAAGLARVTIIPKSIDFNVTDPAGAYYRTTGDITATLEPSPGDGSMRKFKCLSGVLTFAFHASEEINHAWGQADQILILTPSSGVLELIAVPGGWDET